MKTFQNHEEQYLLDNHRELSGVASFESETTLGLFGPSEIAYMSEMRKHRHAPTEQNYWIIESGGEVEVRVTGDKKDDTLIGIKKM